MSICYEVKDWDKHFENSESRRYKSLTWVPVKNKHDGKGYRRVSQHPKSVQVFCAWSLIIQVASKMPTRGLLRDDDGPLTASDLADKTGYPQKIFEAAFEILSDKKVGWLAVSTQQFPQMPADARQNPVNRTEQNKGEREIGDLPEIPPMSRKDFDTLADMRAVPKECANGMAKIVNRTGRGHSFAVIRFKLLYAHKINRYKRQSIRSRWISLGLPFSTFDERPYDDL